MNDEKYKVKWTGAFKKDYKLIQKRGYDTKLLKEVVRLIAKGCRKCFDSGECVFKNDDMMQPLSSITLQNERVFLMQNLIKFII